MNWQWDIILKQKNWNLITFRCRHTWVILYMEMGDFEKALKYYFKVEYLQPANHKVYRPISWCSFMLGKFDNAAKYLEKSLSHGAGKNDYMNLGHIYWCRGEKQKAIENLPVKPQNIQYGY